MILFFYNVALFVALVAGAPWWLWRMATTHKYREGLLERLGRIPPGLASSLSRPAQRPLIWLHAVSVGEVLAVTRLVRALEAALPGYLIAISTTTRTGQATGPRALRSRIASSTARSICPGPSAPISTPSSRAC